MNSREWIQAAIAGERPERIPAAFWQSGIRGGTAEDHARAALALAEEWESSLLITAPAAGYSGEDYTAPGFTKVGGVVYVTDPGDWGRLSGSSVNHGALAREQDALRQILAEKKGDIPVLFRVTSPLATIFRLAFHLPEDIRRGAGPMIKEALKTVTETTCALVQRVIELGADGIFFEAPLADYELISEAVYREYGAPYDLAVLSASSGWCNVLSAGWTNCMFPVLRKYPVQIFAWDAAQSLPDIAEAQDVMGVCCMTGISRRHLEFGLRNEVERDIWHALRATGGRGLILSAGAPVQPGPGMAAFFRKAVQDIGGRLGR